MDKKTIKTLFKDIVSITVYYPQCPKCGNNKKHKFVKIPYGSKEWWESNAMQCNKCEQKFEWGSNKFLYDA